MSNLSDRYTQIEIALVHADVELSVSEVHGTVVGAIANHLMSGVTPDLLKLVEPQADAKDARFTQLSEALYDVYRETSEQLFQGERGLDLVLPDEDELLELRAEGTATWARGYILGLLYNDRFSVDELPDSAPEIVRDLMQIAEAAAGADSEKEEDWALAELQEYMKVGVQLVFEHIYSVRSGDDSKKPPVKH